MKPGIFAEKQTHGYRGRQTLADTVMIPQSEQPSDPIKTSSRHVYVPWDKVGQLAWIFEPQQKLA